MNWAWEIEKTSSGPDAFLFLQFPEEAGMRLERAFGALLIPHYVYNTSSEPVYFYVDSSWHAAKLWTDEHGYTLRSQEGHAWNYAEMRCYQHMLEIESGFLAGDRKAELIALQSLSEQIQSESVDWQIYAGGQGYRWKLFRQGNTFSELIAYAIQNM